ncbi:MAG TPA: enoyl-CoA hydratase/isomerase family protein, partial [Pirellulales bacterium]
MSLTPQQTWLNGGIGQIELGPDEDNATFDEPSLLALRNGFEALAADPGVERIVLCGRRERFVSGVDVSFFIQSLTTGQVDRIISFTYSAHSILNIIARCPKPVVAWIDGPAFGAGLELALACHRIVAGPKARFCLPETGLGIYPGMGGTQRLPRKIGVGLAKWMI